MVDIDHRLLHHELYEKVLYMLTDLDYMIHFNDELIHKFLSDYSHIITFDNDENLEPLRKELDKYKTFIVFLGAETIFVTIVLIIVLITTIIKRAKKKKLYKEQLRLKELQEQEEQEKKKKSKKKK